MTALVLRGIGQRKLRSTLTAIAILLGVAMIAGTYVQTDQITRAFEEIQQTANRGIAVVVSPTQAFTSGAVTNTETLDRATLERVRDVRGVDAVNGDLMEFGQLVVRGEVVKTQGAPGLVFGLSPEPFNPSELVSGSFPARSGEVALLAANAEEERIRLGDRIGITTPHGVREVRVVGTFTFGGSSLGGTTMAIAARADVERWYDRVDEYTAIQATALPGVSPDELRRRLDAVLPRDATVRTGSEQAQADADEINDSIGSFLTPALLAFAGAAVLVGAFIIFNTFSISVAQRRREFAVLRSLGATRRQVLATVALEALVLGVVASVAGIVAGVGFARLLSALFDAAGFGIPRSGIVLAPRTIAVSLAVGIGVTLAAAIVPAIRATRVSPVAAMQDVSPPATRKARRWTVVASALIGLSGLALLVQALFGSGPATSQLASMGGGAVLVFVGVAVSARYLVRPLASAIGWPIARMFATPGELARENAMRNPGRTAATAAALMVGLGLVVFIAVFAAALKSSFGDQLDRLVRADVFITDQSLRPVARGVEPRMEAIPGVKASMPLYYDQIEVDGRASNMTIDALDGVDPAKLRSVYAFEWVDGSDALVARLHGDRALIEEQFAKRHGLAVGERYGVRTPSGGRGSFTVLGIYRDPTMLQGSLVAIDALRRISTEQDPFALFVAVTDEADAAAVQRRIEAALQEFPTVEVRSSAEYKQLIEDRLNTIVYLLYALLAMSVAISMFGIANSLILSIHERTREFGLLRAVGATRSQVRRIVRYESVITAAIGGLLGMAIGVLFAWLTTRSLDEWNLGFALPAGQLVGFVVLAVLVGVAAAALPARRGARTDVLDAIHYE
jgi:putative ABC transport system permease protein